MIQCYAELTVVDLVIHQHRFWGAGALPHSIVWWDMAASDSGPLNFCHPPLSAASLWSGWSKGGLWLKGCGESQAEEWKGEDLCSSGACQYHVPFPSLGLLQETSDSHHTKSLKRPIGDPSASGR